ncbi:MULTISPECIES: hypothetical protein [Halobacterium]|uniref:hypothetical protein n=1 Tax=Halobacterium TaxID=2239 RepID=UPI0019629796|nr:hypothetical protein [Halobacterium sp. BOL4-2]QRY26380.1 hypothetical protein JRZ79_13095 [Halobacterium sp. BOL4-2]
MTEQLTDSRCLSMEIESGDRTMTCPITGQEYVVTRWASRDGRTIALEKEPVEELATDGSGDPVDGILAEFNEEAVVDDGVARRFVAREEFDVHGEPQERTTILQFLEGGGIALTQHSEPGGLSSSLTLGADAIERLLDDYASLHGGD